MREDHTARCSFFRAMESDPIRSLATRANRILVGYSGGADSAALLTLTAAYCTMRQIPCTAIHVHHGIRGAEADRDAEACKAFCETHGIELLVRRVDAPARAIEAHLGLEEAARQLRYEAFEAALAAYPGAICATAHSADDNLETVLHHMLRGSALDGLCGIPVVRGAYIRPLLHASAADIRDFCAVEAIPYVEDSTNTDVAYTRNFIRSEIVPRLAKITPSPEAAVSRMCTHLTSDAIYLHNATEQALGECAAKSFAPLSSLSRMPDALLSRAVAILYENACGDAAALTSVHIRDTVRLVREGRPGRISLPGRLCARLFDRTLSILREEECMSEEAPGVQLLLASGTHFFPEYGFCLRIGEEITPECADGKNIYKLSICSFIPSATISGEIFLRFRRPGDSVRQGGMTRSVKKLLCDKKIPPERRSLYPILCDAAGILWIPGVCLRDPPGNVKPGENILFSYYTR